MKKGLLLLMLMVFEVSIAIAADLPYYGHSKKGALKGADVVSYWILPEGADAVMGSDEFTYDWQGITWKFSTDSNRQAFIAEPERYLPEFGGYCAFAVGLGFTNSILPDSWSIIDGKLYLNHNRFTQKRFLKASEEKIAQAEANWPDVLKKCEQKNNCNRY